MDFEHQLCVLCGCFLETFTETFHPFLFTFEVYASNLWCKDSVRVTMLLLSCQGFWEWWVNLLVKREYTLLEKSGFHSPVQYLKMMEDKALPVITTRIKRSDFQVIFCKCYVKLCFLILCLTNFLKEAGDIPGVVIRLFLFIYLWLDWH